MKENTLFQLLGMDDLLVFLINGRNAGYQGLNEEAINPGGATQLGHWGIRKSSSTTTITLEDTDHIQQEGTDPEWDITY